MTNPRLTIALGAALAVAAVVAGVPGTALAWGSPPFAVQPQSLTGDVWIESSPLSLSTGIITCECPVCPKQKGQCQETTDAISEHTREPTGLLVRVHREGQPPLPVNPNPYVPAMACECPRCP